MAEYRRFTQQNTRFKVKSKDDLPAALQIILHAIRKGLFDRDCFRRTAGVFASCPRFLAVTKTTVCELPIQPPFSQQFAGSILEFLAFD
jgi:hypothetical protein